MKSYGLKGRLNSMKTLDEFIKEITASSELQAELKKVKDTEGADAFLKKNDCDATAAELAEYLKSQMNGAEGELSDDDASAVSGGLWVDWGQGPTWVKDVPIPDRPQTAEPTYQPGGVIIIEDE